MPETSYTRWQSQAIAQKQTANALILGLSGAVLAFLVSQVPPGTSYIGDTQSILFHVSAIGQLIAMICGVAFSLNRVDDFELTARISRTRLNQPAAPKLREMRKNSRRLGSMTKRLFLAQVVSFIIGTIAFLAFVLIRHAEALYAP